MLKLRCQCGETYHAEKRYIGSSILCRACGQILPITPPVRESVIQPSIVHSAPQRKFDSTNLKQKVVTIQSRRFFSLAIFAACVVAALVVGIFLGPKLIRSKPQTTSGTAPITPSNSVVNTATSSNASPHQSPLANVNSNANPIVGDVEKKNDSLGSANASEEPPPPTKDEIHRAAQNPGTGFPPAQLPAIEKIEPRNLEPAVPKTLPLGASPLGPGIKSGRSILTVENGTDTDALVRVISLSGGKLIRNFYVPSSSTFTAGQIPPGNYVLRVALGRDWNESTRQFNFHKSFEETENFDVTETATVEPTNDGTVTHTRYSKTSITLHKVINGNFQSHPISEELFWQ